MKKELKNLLCVLAGGFNELLGYLHESAGHALLANDTSDLLEDYWLRSRLPMPRSPPEVVIKARLLPPDPEPVCCMPRITMQGM